VEVVHTGMLHRILTRPSLLGEFISMDWTTGTIFEAKISIVLLLVLDFECPSFVRGSGLRKDELLLWQPQ